MHKMIEQQKTKVLNEIINLSLIKIARKYLKLLKNNRIINTNEIILDILDSSIYLAEKDIDINDEKFKKTIKKPNKKIKNNILKSLNNINNDNRYKDLVIELCIIFWVIKDKKTQDKVFNKIYELFELNNENLFLNLKNDNFYNDLKCDFINNVKNKSIDFNLPL